MDAVLETKLRELIDRQEIWNISLSSHRCEITYQRALMPRRPAH